MTANQEEISDHETFQMEFDGGSGKWYLRTMQDKYFAVGAGGGVQANSDKRTPGMVTSAISFSLLSVCQGRAKGTPPNILATKTSA